MLRFRSFAYHLGVRIHTLMAVLLDAMCFLVLCLRPAPALAAENLFLHKQLAQYQERHVKPHRANDATRIALVWLSRFFDWRRGLVVRLRVLCPVARDGTRKRMMDALRTQVRQEQAWGM